MLMFMLLFPSHLEHQDIRLTEALAVWTSPCRRPFSLCSKPRTLFARLDVSPGHKAMLEEAYVRVCSGMISYTVELTTEDALPDSALSFVNSMRLAQSTLKMAKTSEVRWPIDMVLSIVEAKASVGALIFQVKRTSTRWSQELTDALGYALGK